MWLQEIATFKSSMDSLRSGSMDFIAETENDA
jgi:hypothetical protein